MAQMFDQSHDSPAGRIGAQARAALSVARSLLKHGMVSFSESSMHLAPWIKRHPLQGIPDVPEGVAPGWVQLPGKRMFALGFFGPRGQFSQIAIADEKGRVFLTDNPNADTQSLEPEFALTSGVPKTNPKQTLSTSTNSAVLRGGAVCERPNGSIMWLATWVRIGKTYNIEQLRAHIPESLRHNLEFRDAVAVMFFAAYLLPRIHGNLLEYGASAILYRLQNQAPLSAIRNGIQDIRKAHAHGLHVTGLEDYAVHLLQEAGALENIPGLQAEHGAEPMHLIQSDLSGNFYLTWDTSLPFDAALASLRIEGAINRFAQLLRWLNTEEAQDSNTTESKISQAQIALVDQALLQNPALGAFDLAIPCDVPTNPHYQAINAIVELTQQTAKTIAQQHPKPTHDTYNVDSSEWIVRQTVATMLRALRLPYRFDADFRDDVSAGKLALAFTTASPALMPKSQYSERDHQWIPLSDADRARMSAQYNLRVGLVMAAIAFGASKDLEEVTLCIESIGLEEAIKEQDTAIKAMMSDVLSSIEHWSETSMFNTADGAKADIRESAALNNPLRLTPLMSNTSAESSESTDEQSQESTVEKSTEDNKQIDTEQTDTQQTQDNSVQNMDTDSIASVDEEFEQLMRTGGIDEVTFAMQEDSAPNYEQDDNPLEQLRSNPTLTSLVTVTFTRQRFLARLAQDGVENPEETYAMFQATMNMDKEQGLLAIDPDISIHDAQFTPMHAQQTPESVLTLFKSAQVDAFKTHDSFGLAIQRDDLLASAVDYFHQLANTTSLASVDKAQQAMQRIERIHDPELSAAAPQITASFIDGHDIPELNFLQATQLEEARIAARDLFFSGQVEQAIERVETAVAHVDELFASTDGVPRYFNSYADRIVYNQLFALPNEYTVLIPDNLFYAHMELADALSQIKGTSAALPHLNKLVAYAPSYALSHLKLATQLAHDEDWDSVKAACLNALRVALDRDDAAYAYYRLAQAAWMRDDFAVATAAYMMGDFIAPNQVASLREELSEVRGRAASQSIRVPQTMVAAQLTLQQHELPVWPGNEITPIMQNAARVAVDYGMFAPARPCAAAVTRMTTIGVAPVQLQFLRSLNP